MLAAIAGATIARITHVNNAETSTAQERASMNRSSNAGLAGCELAKSQPSRPCHPLPPISPHLGSPRLRHLDCSSEVDAKM